MKTKNPTINTILIITILILGFSSCNDEKITPIVRGCTDSNALNYNENATEDDGSCIYKNENLMSDEFNSSNSISNWSNITESEGWGNEHLQTISIDQGLPGKMEMIPHTSAWFEDYRGALIYKEVEGDFVFTTELSVTNRNGTSVPNSNFSLAGPMIRTARNFTNPNNWTANGENYIFLAVGRANGEPGQAQLEIKTTRAGADPYSDLEIENVATTNDVQIRIARIGPNIICMYRMPNQNWIVYRRYQRFDMPQQLQMGLVAYTDWNKVESYSPQFHNSNILNEDLNPDPSTSPNLPFNPDIRAGFEFARFTHLPLELSNSSIENWTDQELLNVLGFESTSEDVF